MAWCRLCLVVRLQGRHGLPIVQHPAHGGDGRASHQLRLAGPACAAVGTAGAQVAAALPAARHRSPARDLAPASFCASLHEDVPHGVVTRAHPTAGQWVDKAKPVQKRDRRFRLNREQVKHWPVLHDAGRNGQPRTTAALRGGFRFRFATQLLLWFRHARDCPGGAGSWRRSLFDETEAAGAGPLA